MVKARRVREWKRTQNIDGMIPFIQTMESILEGLKVTLSHLGDFCSPFGLNTAGICQNPLTPLSFPLGCYEGRIMLCSISMSLLLLATPTRPLASSHVLYEGIARLVGYMREMECKDGGLERRGEEHFSKVGDTTFIYMS